MTTRERQGWIIVASLFVTLFLLFGSGYNTGGLFFPQLVRSFGWTHTRTSWLTSGLAVSAGFTAPLFGWLLDRVEARVVMVAGALVCGFSFLLASQAHSFTPMMAAYLVLGIGISAATLLPCSLVIANWFGARRGLAMGITFAGTSLGGAGMTIAGNFAILHLGGWRAGYIALGIPMIVVVVPIAIAVIRTRPPETREADVHASADALPGLEFTRALRTRSFWMLSAVQFLFAFVAAAAGLHLISHLMQHGYTETSAAATMSLVLALAAVGKLLMGPIADRISARAGLAVNFTLQAIAMLLGAAVGEPFVLPVFVLLFGLTLGAPLVLIPLLTVESLGLKRFGTIAGVAGVFNTIGAAAGPLIAGIIFDRTHSYALAFEIFAALCVAGIAATLACLTLESEKSRLVTADAVASAATAM